MKKTIIPILLTAILASGTAFGAEGAVPTLYEDKPVLISVPIQDKVLGYDLLQVADTMKGVGRITAFESSEDGYVFSIQDTFTNKELILETDENTRINTKMFYDMQLGGIIEVFYTSDLAIAINLLGKESQEGTVYVDGTIEALDGSTVTIGGKVIDLTKVTMSQEAKRALTVGNRAQLVFLTYENDAEYRLKVVPAGEFTVEADGIIKEIGTDPLHKTILVETASGQILLHVSDDTLMAAPFADYRVNDRISFTHSMAMTMSIPPQTIVYTISVPKTPR